MRERLQEFLDHMEMVTSKELSDNEREAVFNDFMKQIQFFQNERLIHLIVTVTFAIIAIFTTLANYVLQSICVFVFLLAIYILLLFYIREKVEVVSLVALFGHPFFNRNDLFNLSFLLVISTLCPN